MDKYYSSVVVDLFPLLLAAQLFKAYSRFRRAIDEAQGTIPSDTRIHHQSTQAICGGCMRDENVTCVCACLSAHKSIPDCIAAKRGWFKLCLSPLDTAIKMRFT